MSYQNMMFKKYSDGNKEILFARPANEAWKPRPSCATERYGWQRGPWYHPVAGRCFLHERMVCRLKMRDRGMSNMVFCKAFDELRNTKWQESARRRKSNTGRYVQHVLQPRTALLYFGTVQSRMASSRKSHRSRFYPENGTAVQPGMRRKMDISFAKKFIPITIHATAQIHTDRVFSIDWVKRTSNHAEAA